MDMDKVDLPEEAKKLYQALDENMLLSQNVEKRKSDRRRSSILKQSKQATQDGSNEDSNPRRSLQSTRRVSFAEKFQVMEMNTGNIYDIPGKRISTDSNDSANNASGSLPPKENLDTHQEISECPSAAFSGKEEVCTILVTKHYESSATDFDQSDENAIMYPSRKHKISSSSIEPLRKKLSLNLNYNAEKSECNLSEKGNHMSKDHDISLGAKLEANEPSFISDSVMNPLASISQSINKLHINLPGISILNNQDKLDLLKGNSSLHSLKMNEPLTSIANNAEILNSSQKNSFSHSVISEGKENARVNSKDKLSFESTKKSLADISQQSYPMNLPSKTNSFHTNISEEVDMMDMTCLSIESRLQNSEDSSLELHDGESVKEIQMCEFNFQEKSSSNMTNKMVQSMDITCCAENIEDGNYTTNQIETGVYNNLNVTQMGHENMEITYCAVDSSLENESSLGVTMENSLRVQLTIPEENLEKCIAIGSNLSENLVDRPQPKELCTDEKDMEITACNVYSLIENESTLENSLRCELTIPEKSCEESLVIGSNFKENPTDRIEPKEFQCTNRIFETLSFNNSKMDKTMDINFSMCDTSQAGTSGLFFNELEMSKIKDINLGTCNTEQTNACLKDSIYLTKTELCNEPNIHMQYANECNIHKELRVDKFKDKDNHFEVTREILETTINMDETCIIEAEKSGDIENLSLEKLEVTNLGICNTELVSIGVEVSTSLKKTETCKDSANNPSMCGVSEESVDKHNDSFEMTREVLENTIHDLHIMDETCITEIDEAVVQSEKIVTNEALETSIKEFLTSKGFQSLELLGIDLTCDSSYLKSKLSKQEWKQRFNEIYNDFLKKRLDVSLEGNFQLGHFDSAYFMKELKRVSGKIDETLPVSKSGEEKVEDSITSINNEAQILQPPEIVQSVKHCQTLEHQEESIALENIENKEMTVEVSSNQILQRSEILQSLESFQIPQLTEGNIILTKIKCKENIELSSSQVLQKSEILQTAEDLQTPEPQDNHSFLRTEMKETVVELSSNQVQFLSCSNEVPTSSKGESDLNELEMSKLETEDERKVDNEMSQPQVYLPGDMNISDRFREADNISFIHASFGGVAKNIPYLESSPSMHFKDNNLTEVNQDKSLDVVQCSNMSLVLNESQKMEPIETQVIEPYDVNKVIASEMTFLSQISHPSCIHEITSINDKTRSIQDVTLTRILSQKTPLGNKTRIIDKLPPTSLDMSHQFIDHGPTNLPNEMSTISIHYDAPNNERLQVTNNAYFVSDNSVLNKHDICDATTTIPSQHNQEEMAVDELPLASATNKTCFVSELNKHYTCDDASMITNQHRLEDMVVDELPPANVANEVQIIDTPVNENVDAHDITSNAKPMDEDLSPVNAANEVQIIDTPVNGNVDAHDITSNAKPMDEELSPVNVSVEPHFTDHSPVVSKDCLNTTNKFSRKRQIEETVPNLAFAAEFASHQNEIATGSNKEKVATSKSSLPMQVELPPSCAVPGEITRFFHMPIIDDETLANIKTFKGQKFDNNARALSIIFNEASNWHGNHWKLKDLDNSSATFTFLWEYMKLSIPFSKYDTCSEISVPLERATICTEYGKVAQQLFVNKVKGNIVITKPLSTSSILNKLKDLSSIAEVAQTFFIDLQHIHAKNAFTLTHDDHSAVLKVRVVNSNYRSVFWLTFVITLDLYPNENIKPAFEHLGGKHISETLVLNAVEQVEPGKNYIWRMAEAAENI